MKKRIISMVLCLTMVMSFVVPGAYAAETTDDIYYVEQTEPIVEPADAADETIAEIDSTAAETTSPVQDTIPEETEIVEEEVVCDCGSPSDLLVAHSDRCAMKAHYMQLCAQSSGQIYAQWDNLSDNAKAYILTYLGFRYPDTLKELVFLLASEWDVEGNLKGVASAIKDGTIFGAFGIPEDAALQIKEAASDTKAAIDSFIANQKDAGKSLFTWDISVLQNGLSWQPDGSVRVELELPGEKLHKYTEVFVVHVDDNGVAERIPAEVIGQNKIAFVTNGFSTFAGYTVDFEYDGVPYSIPGETSILLSELMDQLKMPFDVEAVANVVFSTPELLSVTKEGNDWRLTSLLPFQTNETLTLEMTDGNVYVINVTDATYPKVKISADGTWRTPTNGVLNWYADGDGELSNGWTSKYYASYANYWSQDYTIYVSGSGTLTINIHPASYADSYKVNICQINVDGGAHVKIVMSDEFNTKGKNLVIQNMDDRTMFQVYDGSLEIRGLQDGQRLILDGYGTEASKATTEPIIRLNEAAKKLIVTDVDFRDGQDGAIRCRAKEVNAFTVKRCNFASTIKRDGNGGAIYIFSNTADTKGSYVQIHDFEVSSCTFEENSASSNGGAIAIYGYVHNGLISNCSFNGCTSKAQGGAIDLAGNLGAFTIQNSTFTNCNATRRGGGVAVRSMEIKNSSDEERWTRSNSVAFAGCTFTNCDALESHGGGIAVVAQIHDLTVMGCHFTDCDTAINGAAISIDGHDLPNGFKKSDTSTTDPDWCTAIKCTSCTDYGSAMSDYYNWYDILKSSNTIDKKTWISTVNITDGCTFTNCVAAGNGGAIEFANGLYITDSATISDITIDGCKAVGEGSGIFWSFCYVKYMSVLDSVFKNCSFNPDPTGTKTIFGGTVKTTGNSTLILDMQRCKFIDNYSSMNGGGLYWNANRRVDGLETKATVHDCLFENNTAENYGGGIFTESDIVITKCNIKYNKAYVGGGIAQQVYNNPTARMLDAGGVTELKLDPNTWVHHNTANLGGGVSIRANETGSITDGSPIPYTVRFELNGAAVYQNKAEKLADGTEGHGGGIYFLTDSFPNNEAKQAEVDAYTKEILINQGTGTAAAVYDNYAEGNGGGIYMNSSQDTKLRIEQGYISGNIGNNGGGIYMTGKNATCYVTGGTIGGEGNDSNGKPLSNVAKEDADGSGGCGGGIAIAGGARIEMEGGEISYNNVASNGTNGNDLQGGGIWLAPRGDNGVANTMLLKGGNIKYNSTPGGSGSDGGGVFVGNYGQFTIDNGNIQHNSCGSSWGGGLYTYNAIVNINGGDISQNTAGNGGGIFAHNNSAVSVTGGTIQSNKATSYGGGIYVYSGSDLTVSGGQISKNTAGSGGGIFAMGKTNTGTPVRDTIVQIQGGIVSENVAEGTSSDKGLGGGIYAGNFCDVTISQSGDNVGKITQNTASRGGGVSVDSGAKLTVENGFITYNNAVDVNKSSTFTTTYHMHDGLYGVGGGIYVSNGISSDAYSTVIVQGENIGIYGNLADFAADDVFSNGVNTSLTIPGVQNMNLTEYEFSPEGWVEDYCNADTQYLMGTESVLVQNDYINGNQNGKIDANENVRYRGSSAYNRMIISDAKVASAVNADNAFVCMTLGIPAALADTVVIDFGLPVVINVLDNDMMTRYDKTLAGIYNDKSIDTGDKTYTAALNEGYKLNEVMNCAYGNIQVADDHIKYTPNTMLMEKEDVFSYSVCYGNFYYYADVTVIPATTIYYEDDFVNADGESYISYKTFTYYEGEKDASQVDNQWAVAGNENESIDNPVQDQDRPGPLNGNDLDNIYGSDSAYDNEFKYSMATAMVFKAKQEKVTVEVTENDVTNEVVKNLKTYGTATFDFTGTGFDVISMTSGSTGTVMVEVKQDDTVEKRLIVDTYYGFKYENGKWVASAGDDALYQVPVIKVKDLNPGKHTVTITVTYNAYFDHVLESEDCRSYDFYLDAIRIYDPVNNSSMDETIQDAYLQDNEAWPQYHELRNLIIDADSFDANGECNGIVFIDGTAADKEFEPTISQYTNFGPNNEVYLGENQSIAFEFTPDYTMASVQIAMRGSSKNAAFKIATADGEKKLENGDAVTAYSFDGYYDITDLLRDENGNLVKKTLVITCVDTSESNSVLAISNIKITHNFNPMGKTYNPFTITRDAADMALTYLAGLEGEMDPIGKLDIIGATLSFEDEIRTNLYFTSDLDGAEAEKMGLLTWSAMPEGVCVDNAENVFSGAVYVAENDQFMVQTNGIAAKNLGDDIYMVVYAEVGEGVYTYSDVIVYSPKQYAMSRLEKSSSQELKALCVAMLNYGAAAQEYFNYKTEQLMNADLTAEQKALAVDYNADLFSGAVAVDPAKVGAFAATESGFSGKSASVSFESAFAVNYYFGTDAAVEGDVTFYYWTAEDYAMSEMLTADNASGVVTMELLDNGAYWASITGVAAKDLDKTYYVAAVYNAGGESFCTGVIAYSISTYCMKVAVSGSAMQGLAQMTAVYGYHADRYFNMEG